MDPTRPVYSFLDCRPIVCLEGLTETQHDLRFRMGDRQLEVQPDGADAAFAIAS
jgi:hypothetical protein